MHPADAQVLVELHEVGELPDGDPATICDAEHRQGVTGRGRDGRRER